MDSKLTRAPREQRVDLPSTEDESSHSASDFNAVSSLAALHLFNYSNFVFCELSCQRVYSFIWLIFFSMLKGAELFACCETCSFQTTLFVLVYGDSLDGDVLGSALRFQRTGHISTMCRPQ